MNFLVCPAVSAGSQKQEQNLPQLTPSKDSINFKQLIAERVDFLQRKLKLTDAQLPGIEDIVAANCYESYEEFNALGSQEAWKKKFAAKRRTKFDTELRDALQPQQYVQYLVISEKFHNKFPFGSLI